ncbi:MAG: hypothetical protein K8U57_28025 [Planctomycetes bacterium]|nr:hypothetical protein [Planctomycetota bacterium]
MPDGDENLFVPMRDKQGRVTGIMDRQTADYLASVDPDPSQAVLDAVFSRTTRVRVLGSRVDENRRFQFDVERLAISDPADLAELRECLRIVEDPESFGHMMSLEAHRLELWANDQLLTTLGMLYWIAIRWDRVWKHDAWLSNRLRFEEWLFSHGITEARQQREADEQRHAEDERNRQRWVEAIPSCLLPLWPEQLQDLSPDIPTIRRQLENAVPDPFERVRVLSVWLGSGAGPWSGYPAYESLVEKLLLEYPIAMLIGATQTSAANETQLLGIARLLGGWNFGQKRKKDRSHCPEPLRERLYTVVQGQGIRDNIERFRHAFNLSE